MSIYKSVHISKFMSRDILNASGLVAGGVHSGCACARASACTRVPVWPTSAERLSSITLMTVTSLPNSPETDTNTTLKTTG